MLSAHKMTRGGTRNQIKPMYEWRGKDSCHLGIKASLLSLSSEVGRWCGPQCKWRTEAQGSSSKCPSKSVGGILTQPDALSIESSSLEGIRRDLRSYCTVKFVHFSRMHILAEY